MTIVSLGGPFLISLVVKGGKSAVWPPDRAFEWIIVALVFGLFGALFLACVTIGWWARPHQSTRRPPDR
jgi:hypothetical protein